MIFFLYKVWKSHGWKHPNGHWITINLCKRELLIIPRLEPFFKYFDTKYLIFTFSSNQNYIVAQLQQNKDFVKKIPELFFLDHRPPKRALLLLTKQNSLAGDASFYRETVQNSQTFQAYITKYPSYGTRLTLDSPSKTEELRRKKAASLNTSKRTQSNLPKAKRNRPTSWNTYGTSSSSNAIRLQG